MNILEAQLLIYFRNLGFTTLGMNPAKMGIHQKQFLENQRIQTSKNKKIDTRNLLEHHLNGQWKFTDVAQSNYDSQTKKDDMNDAIVIGIIFVAWSEYVVSSQGLHIWNRIDID